MASSAFLNSIEVNFRKAVKCLQDTDGLEFLSSDLANQINASEMGIVWHTEYVGGPTLADTQAKFGFNSSVLGQTSGVWHRDAIIKDLSGVVTLTN